MNQQLHSMSAKTVIRLGLRKVWRLNSPLLLVFLQIYGRKTLQW